MTEGSVFTSGLIGAISGVLAAIISSAVSGYFILRSSQNQVKAAQIAGNTNISLQREKMQHEFNKEKKKEIIVSISDIYVGISRVNFRNSIGSHIKARQHNIDRKSLWDTYENDRSDLSRFLAIINIDIRQHSGDYIEISQKTSELTALMDSYYWEQDELLRIHEEETVDRREKEHRQSEKVTHLALEISRQTENIKRLLSALSLSISQNKIFYN